LRVDAQRNRGRILHVAMRHFASRGIGAPLEDIAKAAHVGTIQTPATRSI
jgi:AcrR family transcriptional regulator